MVEQGAWQILRFKCLLIWVRYFCSKCQESSAILAMARDGFGRLSVKAQRDDIVMV